jgi:hypothetical protein
MKTVAAMSKYLAKRKASYEKGMASPIEAERNTAHRMLDRITKRTDELFDFQESTKEPNVQTPMFFNGGYTNNVNADRKLGFPQQMTPIPQRYSGVPYHQYPNQSLPRHERFFQEEFYIPDNVKAQKLKENPDYKFAETDIQSGFSSPRNNSSGPFVNPDGTRGLSVNAVKTQPQNLIPVTRIPIGTPEGAAGILNKPVPSNNIRDNVNTNVKNPNVPEHREHISRMNSLPPKGLATSNPLDTFKPEMRNVNPMVPSDPKNKDWSKLGEFASGLAPYLAEFAIRNNAINKMETPPSPTYLPPIHFNTALDTAADENTAKRMMRIRQLNAERYAPNSQALMGEYGKATADNSSILNQISQQRNNYRAQMENSQIAANQEVSSQNVQLSNFHNSELNQFVNDRLGAKANNAINLVQKITYLMQEGRMKEHDLKKLKIMSAKFPKPIQDQLNELLNGE